MESFYQVCKLHFGNIYIDEGPFLSKNKEIIQNYIQSEKFTRSEIIFDNGFKIENSLNQTLYEKFKSVERNLKLDVYKEFGKSNISLSGSEVIVGERKEVIFKQAFIYLNRQLSFEEKVTDLIVMLSNSPVTEDNFIYSSEEREFILLLGNYKITWDSSELSNVVNIGISLRKLRKLNTIRELIARLNLLM